ncbi:MAG: hypothetical protein M1830_009389 [Pleopsidium flavum]|nr:MAG: hypothetical protein M1830_009389 [Pleopsidium flavum]
MPPKRRTKSSLDKPTPAAAKRKGGAVPPETQGKPSQPVRRSTRISAQAEAKQKQVQPVPALEKQGTAPKSRNKPTAHSVPKPQKSNTRQRSEASAAVPQSTESNTSQVLRKKTKKKPYDEAVPRGTATSRLRSSLLDREVALVPSNSNPIQSSAVETTERAPSETSHTGSSSRLSIGADIVEYYRSRGYEVPEEEYMSSTLHSTPVPPSEVTSIQGKKPKKPPTVKATEEEKMNGALLDHKIDTRSTLDVDMKKIEELVLSDCSSRHIQQHARDEETNRREEKYWEVDMSKCASSNEAVFQRTIMMTILNRHKLDDKLDYICEAIWISERFPCKDCKEKECKISKPQPDLAVAFKTTSLLPDDAFTPDLRRLGLLIGHMFPEGEIVSKSERAFHFFALEVKGKRGTIDNTVAEFQNLNTASQGLYNMYRCLKEANDLDTFFKEVRFFSALATTESFSLRVHRPLRLRSSRSNNPEYPIGFGFAQVIRIRGDYSKSKVLGIMHNILSRYGVERLYPILKRTMRTLLELDSSSASQSSLDELNPGLASQSSPRKRTAENLDDSFNSLASSQRRRVDNLNVHDSQE